MTLIILFVMDIHGFACKIYLFDCVKLHAKDGIYVQEQVEYFIFVVSNDVSKCSSIQVLGSGVSC